jgi:hypothetical protein
MVKLLAQRMFIYDPLDREYEENSGLKRTALLGAVDSIPSISQPESVFRLVLTDADEVNLTRIITAMSGQAVEHYR